MCTLLTNKQNINHTENNCINTVLLYIEAVLRRDHLSFYKIWLTCILNVALIDPSKPIHFSFS